MPSDDDLRRAYQQAHGEVEQMDTEAEQVSRAAVTAMLVAALAANDDSGDGATAPNPETITAAARQAWTRAVRRVLDWIETTVRRAIVARLSRLPRADGHPEPRPVSRQTRQRIREIAADYVRQVSNRLVNVPDQVWETVQTTLADGYQAGETPQQLRARVAEALNISEWAARVERIARTETTGAFGFAQSTALDLTETELGEPLRRMWIASMDPAGQPDDRVRPEHRAAHRQIVASGEPFTVGGFPMRFPGDPSAPVHLVANCRCAVVAVAGDLVIGLSDDAIQQEREAMQNEYETLAADDEVLVALPTRMPQQLVEYWTRGEGAAKIRWGTGGDFTRCTRQLREYIKNPNKLKGTCANLHKLATGRWPAERGAAPTTLAELEELTSEDASEYDGYDFDDPDEQLPGACNCGYLATAQEPATSTDIVGEHETAPTVAQPEEGVHDMDTVTATVVGETDLPIADRNRDWDGDKARTRVLDWATNNAGDVDAAKLSQAFLYRDPDKDPETLAAYKLGFADVIDGRLRIVAKGVYAAAARIDQVDVPEKERDRMRSRLNTLYERLRSKFDDDDLIPPWERDNDDDDSRKSRRRTIDTTTRRRRAKVSEPRMIDVDDLVRRLRNTRGRTINLDDIDDLDDLPELRELLTSITASAALDHAAIVAEAAQNAPEQPPADWFTPRALDGPTPITVTARGEVYGHLAPWDVPHVGIRDENVYAPRSRVNYDLFHSKDVVTADGTTIRAGVLLVGCDHAPIDADVADARDYHEQVCTPAAVVRAYEDDYGIAVTGSLLPGLTVDQVAQLRKLSGEWRTAHLELMAAVGVEKAGFPVPGAREDTVAVAASADTATRDMLAHIPRLAIRADGSLDEQALAVSIADELEARELQRRREQEVVKAYAVVADARKKALARKVDQYRKTRRN
ncbi:hypothetical protein PIS_022 [Saccharomonospora phage PIS 136]|nr:hypothetical protein PIS_022 [Saccharomonospora phage PIS 136]